MELQTLGGLIGLLNSLPQIFHPEISFQICEIRDAMIVAIKPTNKAAKFIQSTPNATVFPMLGRRSTTIKLFTNKTYYKFPNNVGVLLSCDKDKKSCPSAWSSKSIKRVVKPTLAAETVGFSEECDTTYLASELAKEANFLD